MKAINRVNKKPTSYLDIYDIHSRRREEDHFWDALRSIETALVDEIVEEGVKSK